MLSLQHHLVYTFSLCLCLKTTQSWPLDPLSRRNVLQKTIGCSTVGFFIPTSADAYEDERKTVTVRLGPNDSLGVQVYNTNIRGKSTVAIRNVTKAKNPNLKEGMILKDYTSAETLIERIRSGPFPVELEFVNLAAGGDAFSDMGTTLVTPKDALELAQKIGDSSGVVEGPKYSIETLRKSSSTCAIQSRRADVLEIVYDASYKTIDDRKIVYDSSSSRGTGQPYQMVLGSGDMIAGVDQGLYDMCPGEVRRLEIPRLLGYGNRALQSFRIPPDYVSLEWRIQLISIGGMIREKSNDLTREEREGRAL